MNRRIMLPVFAVIAALAIVFTASSFKANDETKPLVDYYFQYDPAAADDENDYENVNNWDVLPSPPAENPCSGAIQMVCVLKASFVSPPDAQDLVDFLSSHPISAESYCQDPDNILYYKPRP